MKYEPKKFKDKELLEVFPEAKEIIPLKIKELKIEINKINTRIKNFLDHIYSLGVDSFSIYFAESFAKHFMVSELLEYEKHLKRLQRLRSLLNPNKYKMPFNNFQQKIDCARNYSIQELANSKLDIRKSGKNFISLCPFHNEKTPSFFIFPQSNQFHCFGCGEHGDVIKLTMTLYSVEFKEAVLMLNN